MMIPKNLYHNILKFGSIIVKVEVALAGLVLWMERWPAD